MLPQLFARRYLFSSQSRSVVNLISGLSVAAVAMPVAAMIILLSVFNGFESLVKSMYSAFDADLTVSPRQGQTFAQRDLDTAALARIPGVGALSFTLEQSALLEHGGRQATATIRGVDDAYGAVFQLGDAVSAGSGACGWAIWNGWSSDSRWRGCWASARWPMPTSRSTPCGGDRSPRCCRSKTTRAARNPWAASIPSTSKPNAPTCSPRCGWRRSCSAIRGRASALVVRLAPGADAAAVRKAVAEAAGDGFRVRTRDELRASFYRIMTYEKWGIFFIALLVLIIASFSVVGALAMLIVEKRDDISTLRALGADTGLVRAVFRTEGFLICGLGAVAGMTLGVATTLSQQYFGLIEIPAETFLTKSYPVEFRPTDLAVVAASFAAVAALLSNITVRSMIKTDRL